MLGTCSIAPAVFGIGFLLVWEFVVQAFDLKPYFLPDAERDLEAFVDNFASS